VLFSAHKPALKGARLKSAPRGLCLNSGKAAARWHRPFYNAAFVSGSLKQPLCNN
jgi:hypothetical protein